MHISVLHDQSIWFRATTHCGMVNIKKAAIRNIARNVADSAEADIRLITSKGVCSATPAIQTCQNRAATLESILPAPTMQTSVVRFSLSGENCGHGVNAQHDCDCLSIFTMSTPEIKDGFVEIKRVTGMHMNLIDLRYKTY